MELVMIKIGGKVEAAVAAVSPFRQAPFAQLSGDDASLPDGVEILVQRRGNAVRWVERKMEPHSAAGHGHG